jgi:small subunit ribosomal protein S9
MPVKSKKTKTIKKATKKRKPSKTSYIYSVGRRRCAIARVRLYTHKKGGIIVNDKPIDKYFFGEIAKKFYFEPLRICNVIDKHLITIKVVGSGKSGQLGAVIHGISRALEKLDREKFRPILKKRGFLTRDPRKKERRKVGTGGKARRKKQSPRR